MKNKIKLWYGGYITVYLSLMLGLIITFITTMLIGIRIHTIRFETECVMDMGLDSVFAEYHRELLKQYGLLFIDSSYGSSIPSKDYTCSHLLHYMNSNFSNNSKNIFSKNLTSIRADNATLSNISYGSDNRGEVLLYQICQYEKDKNFLDMADGISEKANIEEILSEYEGKAAERDGASNKVESIMEEVNGSLEEEEVPYEISNPADAVESLTESSVVYYALGDINKMTPKSVNISDYISHRSYVNGVGLRSYQKISPLNKVILEKYIFEKCGYHKRLKENSKLCYQIEYLIAGKESDLENLEKVAEDIFKTRYVINMAHLFSSADKQTQAQELASAVCVAIGNPELIEAVKYTILFAWGYAESAKDLRILYDGHSLSAVKTDAEWNTPISQIVVFKEYLDSYSIPNGSLSYENYLKGFLLLKDTEEITMRLMDIMEMDIRETVGNSSFKMDGQIYQLTASVNVSSGYGYGCNITRGYSYE